MASIRTQIIRRKTIICQRENLRKWYIMLRQDKYKIVFREEQHVDGRTKKKTGKSKIIGEKEI